MVCGNDGTTYPTICALTEEATSRGSTKITQQLVMEYWGPCKEGALRIY